MSHAGPPPPPAEGSIVLPSQSVKPGLSIRSILLIMLLLVSVASSVVVGLIGYVNGRDSLQDAAFDRLIEVRDSRAREVVALFQNIENALLLSARGETVAQATQQFAAAFQELESTQLTDEERATIESYFTDTFGPQLEEATGSPVDASTFVPTDPAQSFLALHYTAPFADPADAIAVDDAGDGSAWSATHARYHDFFRRMTQLLSFEDVLLIDSAGNVVYSAYKGVDLGSNLDSGPLQRTNLAHAYSEAMTGNVADTVVLTDFAPFPPSLGTPAAWAVTPVAVDGAIIGALAVEMPIDQI
ncbi:MAG TPA: hypothetical protein VGD87_09335, partial [Archangium sp.]